MFLIFKYYFLELSFRLDGLTVARDSTVLSKEHNHKNPYFVELSGIEPLTS